MNQRSMPGDPECEVPYNDTELTASSMETSPSPLASPVFRTRVLQRANPLSIEEIGSIHKRRGMG